MSFLASEWASSAPVATVYERVILQKLAHHARPDGERAYPSQRSIAETACCSQKSVQRHLNALIKRGLVRVSPDQTPTSGYRADKRPVVYDLLIPRSWYSQAQLDATVNPERFERGRPPLASEERPDLPPPPAKKSRRDSGESRTPHAGGLSVPPREHRHDGARGDSESEAGGLEVQPRGDSESNKHVIREHVRESPERAREAAETDPPAHTGSEAETEDSNAETDTHHPQAEAERIIALVDWQDRFGAGPQLRRELADTIRAALDRGIHPHTVAAAVQQKAGEARYITYVQNGLQALTPNATSSEFGVAAEARLTVPDWCGGCDPVGQHNFHARFINTTREDGSTAEAPCPHCGPGSAAATNGTSNGNGDSGGSTARDSGGEILASRRSAVSPPNNPSPAIQEFRAARQRLNATPPADSSGNPDSSPAKHRKTLTRLERQQNQQEVAA